MSKSYEEYQEITKRFFQEGCVNSPLNGEQPVLALLGHNDVRSLEGKLLTLLDASIADPTQRKAIKDLTRQVIWWQWVPDLDQGPNVPGRGMPIVVGE